MGLPQEGKDGDASAAKGWLEQKHGAEVRGGSSQVTVDLNQVWSFCLLAVVLSVQLYWVENTYFV